MPGSWELLQRKKVLVGILHTDLVSLHWAMGLRTLEVPGDIYPIAGMPYDHARNTICAEALKGGYEWVFFLDSDVVPPSNVIPRLMAHRKPFISGVYARRSPPIAVPVMQKNGQWVTNLPAPGQNPLIEVDVVGAGCLLIHTSLLAQLPPQRPQAGKVWFDWRVDCQGVLPPHECMSEDFTLCLWARKHGVPVVVDTSVRCRHIGLADAGVGVFGSVGTVAVA